MMVEQGGIYLADLNPTKGHEQKGIRPVVVISGNAFHVSEMCFICPLTTSLKHFFGDIILSPDSKNGLSETSEILTGQIRTIDVKRMSKKLGMISESELQNIFRGINMLLENF